MATKQRREHQRSDHSETEASLFSKVATEITTNQALFRISQIDGEKVDIPMPGTSATIEFNLTSDMLAFADHFFTPETASWMRMAQLIHEAKSDPLVARSTKALAFLAMIQAIAQQTAGNWREEKILAPISVHMKSQQASRSARLKNATPRAWVKDEWLKRTDCDQSKAAFSRQYAQLVKKKFKVDVTADQIARAWLTE